MVFLVTEQQTSRIISDRRRLQTSTVKFSLPPAQEILTCLFFFVVGDMTRLAEYAQVTRMLGNGRCESKCFDGTTRLCHIRGKLRKKVWVNAQDIVLVGLRDYQDDKADIILKYSPDEARNLIKYGEIPDTTTINENAAEGEEGEEGDDVVFDFEAIDEI